MTFWWVADVDELVETSFRNAKIRRMQSSEKGNSDANLSAIRRFAFSMLKNDKSEKLGIKK